MLLMFSQVRSIVLKSSLIIGFSGIKQFSTYLREITQNSTFLLRKPVFGVPNQTILDLFVEVKQNSTFLRLVKNVADWHRRLTKLGNLAELATQHEWASTASEA